jgi:hypothetical protein
MLGYHATPGDLSMLEYSRDAMAGPLRSLAKVIADVRSGHFDPDSTRSGRFARSSAAQGPADPPAEARGSKRSREVDGEEDLVLQVLEKKIHMLKGSRTRCNKKVNKMFSPYNKVGEDLSARLTYCLECLAA